MLSMTAAVAAHTYLKSRGRVKVLHHIHVIVHHRELVSDVYAEALGDTRVPIVVQRGGDDQAEYLVGRHVPRHVDRRHEKVHGLRAGQIVQMVQKQNHGRANREVERLSHCSSKHGENISATRPEF